MKCPHCGSEVRDGVAFCTSCGQPLPEVTSDIDNRDVQKDVRGDAENSARRGPRRRLVIAACAALLLVAVATGGAFVLHRIMSPQVATYGSDGVVTLARVARIVPHDEEGNPLEHYYVRILQAIDARGNAIDTSGVQDIEVMGTDGFTVEDMLQGAPDGTYYPQVVDDDETALDLPPIEVSDEGSDKTLIIEQGPSGIPAVSEADRLYLQKLEEQIATWGEATVQTLPAEDEYSFAAAYIDGAAFAKLVDFGDGVERLVVAHLEDEDAAREMFRIGGGIGAYRVEVWGYNSASGALDLLWDMYASGSAWEGALGTEIALSYIDFVRNPDDGSLCLCIRDASSSLGDIKRTYYAISDAGEFEVVKTIECRIDETAEVWESWYVDDAQVDEADYDAELDRWNVEACYLLANRGETVDEAQTALRQPYASATVDESAVTPVGEAALITHDTLDELRKRVGESGAETDGATGGATQMETDRDPGKLSEATLEQFESKLDELVDTYGTSGSYASQTTGSQAYAYAKGLCFARVIDFGDGVQRLVTACCTSASFSGPSDISPERYQVEVWRYDEAEEKLILDWQGNAAYTNSGFPLLALWTDKSGNIFLQASDAGTNGLTLLFAAPDASGAFGQVDTSAENGAWVRQDSYMFLGVGDSSDQALDAASTVKGEGGMESVQHSVSETVETVSSALLEAAGNS